MLAAAHRKVTQSQFRISNSNVNRYRPRLRQDRLTENCVRAHTAASVPKWVGSKRELLRGNFMMWILWALMLICHGALTRWAKTARSYANVSVLGDVLLIAIALVTIDQLQGLGILDLLRVGIFFTAFGYAGRQLMGSLLRRAENNG